MIRSILFVFFGLLLVQVVNARPYPAATGIAAAADSAAVAANNPAGMTRFDSLNMRFEALGFFSDNTWESQIGANGPTVRSEDSSSTFIPTISLVMPLKNDWHFGFTVLGMASSEDFGKDWPGRYIIQDYDLLYVSAFPSIARRLNDKWSFAASLALTYTSYEQNKAVPNIDDGFGDGSLTVDADDTTVGFGLSTLYEHSDRTRFGLVYRSELDADLNDNAKFSGLGPTTEAILEAAGLLGAAIDITSRTPQSITAGMYHEFSDRGAFTFDLAWIDFSEFILSEIFVNGDQIVEQTVDYEDIWAVSAGYSRPVSERFTLGFGAAYVDDMVSDDQRTLTLRLDSVWVVGIGLEWQWTPTRAISTTLNYIEIGDAPVTTPPIEGIGAVSGSYTDRGTIWLQVSFDIGKGPK